MRITNSMIAANTKANININKEYSDRLNSMIASGQKIVRPSDDPVVAIRAMRLNTTIDELTQYHSKNIPDADAWYTDTETALTQANDVLSSIREKLNQASSEENVTSNVKDILEELKQLKAQYYALGNADSAGRTVFTGFRTNEQLTFKNADTIQYQIYEKKGFDDIEAIDYVKGTRDINIAGNNLDNYDDYDETDIQQATSYRIRLAYGNIDAGAGSEFSLVAKDKDGNEVSNVNAEVVSLSGKTQAEIDDLYLNQTSPILIKETGELIIPKDLYNTMAATNDLSIDINYYKSEWQKGDPRPEHYFQCNTPVVADDPRTYEVLSDGTKVPIEYNYNRVDAEGNPTTDRTASTVRGFIEQEINYEIAFNQTIQINTNASNTFSHDIGRDIDDLVNITQELEAAEANVKTVEDAYNNETNAGRKEKLGSLLETVKKQQTYLRDKMHKMYSEAITKFDEHSETVNNEISKIGALTSRLELTKNRIKDQTNNVKSIADSNINADLSETAIDYKAAQLALEAAQMAAGKIANQTLLNYI